MQREEILKKLREQGCRITKQRQLLLDIILQEEYSCCKRNLLQSGKQRFVELVLQTVYRMIKYIGGYREPISRNTMVPH